jgi:hypothetical protein
MSQTITIHCKIVAIQNDNQYTHIVVEDLSRNYDDDLKYVTVVKLPNWDSNTFELDEEGYVLFQPVEAGVTRWFNRELRDFEIYNYSNNYFINFIKKMEICNKKEFKF